MFNPSFEEKNSSLTKFEEMLKTNQVLSSDAVEFENIIHYYISLCLVYRKYITRDTRDTFNIHIIS